MEEDKNVYKKVGRKYVPIGYRIEDRWLTDGIWIVKHKESLISRTNAGYLASLYGLIKVGELSNVDLIALSAMEDYAEVAAKVISDNCGEKGMTTMNLARLVVKALFDFNEEKSKK